MIGILLTGSLRSPPKGDAPEWYMKMVHEVYDSLFFPSYLSFPLEGKCLEEAKGCTGLSRDMTLYHFPDRQSAAPNRSDAQQTHYGGDKT